MFRRRNTARRGLAIVLWLGSAVRSFKPEHTTLVAMMFDFVNIVAFSLRIAHSCMTVPAEMPRLYIIQIRMRFSMFSLLSRSTYLLKPDTSVSIQVQSFCHLTGV